MQKYDILTLLGKGAFSTVYHAINIRTKQPVAIKMTHVNNTSTHQLLVREAKIYGYLKNVQGVPTLLWVGVRDEMYYITMPLYYGTISTITLVSITDVVKYGNELLDILKHVHRLGIIHRDIKPDNIMVDKYGRLVIIDFGLSAFIPSGSYSPRTISEIIGTPNYVSIHVHELTEPGMRDDVESVMYVLLFLWNSHTLPWSNDTNTVDIVEKKQTIRMNPGKVDIPELSWVSDYLTHNDKLNWIDFPEYSISTLQNIKIDEYHTS